MHVCNVSPRLEKRRLINEIPEENAIAAQIGLNVGRCCDMYTYHQLTTAVPPSTGRLSLITEAPLRGEIEWVLKRVELVRGALRCRYRGARRAGQHP